MAQKKLPAKMKKYTYNNVKPPKKGMQRGGEVAGSPVVTPSRRPATRGRIGGSYGRTPEVASKRGYGAGGAVSQGVVPVKHGGVAKPMKHGGVVKKKAQRPGFLKKK